MKLFQTLCDPPTDIYETAETCWDDYKSGYEVLDRLALGEEVEDDDGLIWRRVQ